MAATLRFRDTDPGKKVAGKSFLTQALGWINSMFNPSHAWFDYDALDNKVNSVANQITKEDLTGEQKAMNQFNLDEAQKQRDWEEQMSNTAYQRQVKDMQAAGVNPAMAMSGSGASTPSGVAATASAGSSVLSFSDLMQLFMMPLQKKLMESQSQMYRDQGQAALMNAGAAQRNAGTNERNAGTNERNAETERMRAETDRMRYDLEKSRTLKQNEVSDEEMKEIAARVARIKLETEQMPRQLEIAQQHADAATKSAAASLQSALAAVRNAAVNEKLSEPEVELKKAQAFVAWANGDGQEITNKYLDERQRTELSNLHKEGVYLDKRGQLVDKQGKLVTAQTVKTYVNCATDVSGAVNQWLNPFSKGPGSSNSPGFDLSGAYQGVAYGYD